MSQLIHKDGIVLNGRRYNSPEMQKHLYKVVDVEVKNNVAGIYFDNKLICFAHLQNLILIPEPKAGDRVQIKEWRFGNKYPLLGTVVEYDRVEWLIVIDNDDEYPHGFNRDDFDVISGVNNAN